MKKDFEAKLWVNNAAIELNPFVEEFLARTAIGAVSALKGTEGVKSLDLRVEKGDVKAVVNGKDLSLTAFPNDIIANTLTGLASTLKGVGKVETLRVEVRVL